MTMRFRPHFPILFLFLISQLVLKYNLSDFASDAQEEFRRRELVEDGKPKLANPDLKVEEVVSGLDTPTTYLYVVSVGLGKIFKIIPA